MLKVAFAAAAALLALPSPSVAQIVFDDSPAATPAKAGKEAQAGDDKVICRMQEEIGSRLDRKRVCMTAGQWRQYEADNKEKVERLQQTVSTRPSG
jgi:hypothetical protein